MADESPRPASFSTNAARAAVTLLELGNAGVAGTTLKDLAAAVGEAKPAMLRSLTALSQHGFVEQVSRGRYRLGPSIYSLAKKESAVHVEVAKWRPALELLAEKLRNPVSLVRRAGLDVVVIDMQLGASPFHSFATGVGGRLPMGIGAGSLAMLATLDPPARKEIIARNADRYQDYKQDVSIVMRCVDQAVPRDFAADVGSRFPDWGGLAVPIRERGEYASVMSLTMTGPKSFFDTHNHGDVAGEIRQVITRVQSGLPIGETEV